MGPALAAANGCDRPGAPDAPQPVKTAIAATQQVRTTIRARGTIVAVRTEDLRFSTAGVVARLHQVKTGATTRPVHVGDVVPGGTILAQLDEPESQREILVATRARELASLKLDQATAAFDVAFAELVQQPDRDGLGAKWMNLAIAHLKLAQREHADADEKLKNANQRAVEIAIKAPFARTLVMRKTVAPGQKTGTDAAFSVADLDSLEAGVQLPPEMTAGYSLDRRVDVNIADSSRRPARARVRSVNKRLVELALDNADGSLRPGMEFTISEPQEKAALLVPLTAIQNDDAGRTLVYVVDDDIARAKRIDIGGVFAGGAEVKPGSEIAGGEKVVVAGGSRLVDGARVRPVQGQ